MLTLAVVDAGPLYTAADADDGDREASLGALSRADLRLVVPALVVAEATYFVGQRLGASAESAFLRGIGTLDVEGPADEDFLRMAELVDQYADCPLGGTAASVIALAERLEASTVITLDHRHFAAVRPQPRATLELLPLGTRLGAGGVGGQSATVSISRKAATSSSHRCATNATCSGCSLYAWYADSSANSIVSPYR
jgi:uncharacterized protein